MRDLFKGNRKYKNGRTSDDARCNVKYRDGSGAEITSNSGEMKNHLEKSI